MNFYEKGNILVVYGGRCDLNKDHPILNDLHALRLDNLEWLKIEYRGETPQPKANHCSTIVESRIIIFGGYCEGFILNNDT
jgi:hypothetical protein